MQAVGCREHGGRVAGRIEVVTPRPIVLPRPGSPRARAQALLGDRDWLVAAVAGSLALMALRSSAALRAGSSPPAVPPSRPPGRAGALQTRR